jgi:hypothetical protein
LNGDEQVIICTDANPYQVGSMTFLKGKPATAYTKKLANETPCTTTGPELLSIVNTLKAHHDVLSHYKIKVYTNNHTQVYEHIDTEHVACWCLIPQ